MHVCNGRIIGNAGSTFTAPLVGDKPDGKYGTITVMAEQQKGNRNDVFACTMRGIELANKVLTI